MRNTICAHPSHTVIFPLPKKDKKPYFFHIVSDGRKEELAFNIIT